jgi:hypothetical protein
MQALNRYRKVLQVHPECPASARVGIGMCFARLDNPEKAQEAFARARDGAARNGTDLRQREDAKVDSAVDADAQEGV